MIDSDVIRIDAAHDEVLILTGGASSAGVRPRTRITMIDGILRLTEGSLEEPLPVTGISVPLALLIEAGLVLPEMLPAVATRDGTRLVAYGGNVHHECFTYFAVKGQTLFCLQQDLPADEHDTLIAHGASAREHPPTPRGIPLTEYARARTMEDTRDERSFGLEEEIATSFSMPLVENYVQRVGRSFRVAGDQVVAYGGTLVVPRRRALVAIPLRLLLSAGLTSEDTLRMRGAKPIDP
jgi:hypothetical protein